MSVAGYVTDTTYNLNRRSKQEQKKCLHLLCLARRRKTKSTAKKNPKDGKNVCQKIKYISTVGDSSYGPNDRRELIYRALLNDRLYNAICLTTLLLNS